MDQLQCTPRTSKVSINIDNCVVRRNHRKLQCGFCGSDFEELSHLENHMQYLQYHMTKKKSKQLQCQICGRILSDVQNLFDHCKDRLKEETEANLSFECSFCEKRFVASCLLRRHLYLKHDVIYSEPSGISNGTKESKGKLSEEKQNGNKATKKKPNEVKCDYCTETFREGRGLSAHIDINHEYLSLMNSFPCLQCSKRFIASYLLRRHASEVHEITISKTTNTVRETNDIQCDYCTKRFSESRSLLGHLNTSHKLESLMDKVSCRQCSKTFIASYFLKRHVSLKHGTTSSKTLETSHKRKATPLNHPPFTSAPPKIIRLSEEKQNDKKATNENNFKCDICDLRCHTMEDLEQHVRSIHPELSNTFQCSICEAKFWASSSLLHHNTLSHKNDSEASNGSLTTQKVSESKIVESSANKQNGKEADIDNDLECDICFTSLETLMDLDLHVKSNHTELTSAYQCNFCNESFGASILLLHHVTEWHKNDLETPQQESESQTAKSSEKKQKEESATDENNFKCYFCDKRGKTTEAIELHVRSSHIEFSNAFQCYHCDAAYGSSDSLSNHIKQFHEINSEASKSILTTQKASTSRTVKSFEEKQNKESATNVNNFKCDLCDKRSETTEAIEVHVSSSHPELSNAFQCYDCDAAYGSSSSLSHHIKQFHEINLEDTKSTLTTQKASASRTVKSFEGKQNKESATNENNFKCDLCDKRSETTEAIEVHVSSSHPELSNAFQCNYCDAAYGSTSSLEHHITQFHPIDSEASKSILTAQKVSGSKTFKSMREKINDKESTSGNNTFKCDFCEMRLETLDDLELHIRSSHTDHADTFYCNKCSASFGASILLSQHIPQWHSNDMENQEVAKLINDSCFQNKDSRKEVKDQNNDKLTQLKEENLKLREENRKKDLEICKVLKLATSDIGENKKLYSQIIDMVTKIEQNHSNSTILDECQKIKSNLEKTIKLCNICNQFIHKNFILTHQLQYHTKPSKIKLKRLEHFVKS